MPPRRSREVTALRSFASSTSTSTTTSPPGSMSHWYGSHAVGSQGHALGLISGWGATRGTRPDYDSHRTILIPPPRSTTSLRRVGGHAVLSFRVL